MKCSMTGKKTAEGDECCLKIGIRFCGLMEWVGKEEEEEKEEEKV